MMVCAPSIATVACSGIQSALAPAGHEAQRVTNLFWWMAAGAIVIWIATIAIAVYCARVPPRDDERRRTRMLIVGGGVLVPAIILTILLVYGLAMLPPLVARAPEGSLRIDVRGELWWWRVRYVGPGDSAIELANEIRLPVGERVQFRLDSDNVIHSFWIPSLGGKMDMVPGRVTYLSLQPTRTGVFRGACAEYCGSSHARMNFYVEVLERDAFARWLENQAAPARTPATVEAQRGQDVFLESGCNACHRIAGTPAAGVIGPDLTHVGSRMSIGAGMFRNDPASVQEWIRRTNRVKPGAHMPAFDMLPSEHLRALAAYLESLK